MMESMIENPIPTRAEVFDVAMLFMTALMPFMLSGGNKLPEIIP